MASSEEINVLSICVDLLDNLEGSAANRISNYLNNKYAESPNVTILPVKKKRGRPAKIKPVETNGIKRKRGRPAKVKSEAPVVVKKKRGRPAKMKTEMPEQAPKKRGRPAKIKEEVTAPKRRRGRPSKVTTVISAPKKRGRPAKKKRGRPASIESGITRENAGKRGRPRKG
jgi:hypothetical protein